MGNKPFDRHAQNQLEKWLSRDLNLGQSYIDESLRALLRLMFTGRFSDSDDRQGLAPDAFLADSLKARGTLPLGNSVLIRKGIGFQLNDNDNLSNIVTNVADTIGINDLEGWKPLVLAADKTVNLVAPPAAPNSRIDILEVRYNRHLTDVATKFILDAGSETFIPNNEVQKTLSWALDDFFGQVQDPAPSTSPFGYKVGIAANPPTAPATTAGYVKIAEILVPNLVTNPTGEITESLIKDMRGLLMPYGSEHLDAKFVVTTTALGPPTVTHINTPPGVKLVVVSTSTTGARTTVFIIPGASNANLAYDVDIEAYQRVGDAPFMFWVTKRLTTAYTLTAADQTAIQGPNAGPSGVLVAVGQPAIKLELSTLVWKGGGGAPDDTPGVGGIGTTVVYRLTGRLGR